MCMQTLHASRDESVAFEFDHPAPASEGAIRNSPEGGTNDADLQSITQATPNNSSPNTKESVLNAGLSMMANAALQAHAAPSVLLSKATTSSSVHEDSQLRTDHALLSPAASVPPAVATNEVLSAKSHTVHTIPLLSPCKDDTLAFSTEKGPLFCNLPPPNWTFCNDAYSFSGVLELAQLHSEGRNAFKGVVQRFKNVQQTGVFETPLELF